jgi:hypothetical protein
VQVHLGFAHQATILDESKPKPAEHQAHRDLGSILGRPLSAQ